MATMFLAVVVMMVSVTPARAATPWWRLASSTTPTNLAPGGEGTITLLASNVGDASVNAAGTPVTIADKLPTGVTATAISGVAGHNGVRGTMECTLATLSCGFAGPALLAPYELFEVTIKVKVEGTVPADAENEATISGGGAAGMSVKHPVAVSSAAAPFGIERYEMTPEDEGGGLVTQAGAHPFQLTTTIALNQTLEVDQFCEAECRRPAPAGIAKDLRVNLPPGLIGNPTAVAQCTELAFNTLGSENINFCPASSAIGVATATINIPDIGGSAITVSVPLFNLVPTPGEPARFGFEVEGVPVVFDTQVRTGGDYGVTVTVSNLSQAVGFLSSAVTIWGVPGDPRHDQSRGWNCIDAGLFESGPCNPLGQKQPPPFLTLPTSCSGPVKSSLEADPWASPGRFLPPREYAFQDSSGRQLGLDGCNRLRLNPAISVAPDVSTASTPAGLAVNVHVPQDTTLNATGLAESDVREATVAFPEGLQLSPAVADGLQACSLHQIALQTAEQPTCPEASKVATAEVKTPLLPNPLIGAVYVAAQNANPFGSLVAVYLVVQDPVSGVLVKLAGDVKLSDSGQILSTFENTPQLPFEDLTLHFFGGPRAALSTPSGCGTYPTTGSFAPWSGNPAAVSTADFAITAGPGGSPCAAPLPFRPSATAGSANIQGGAFAPFTTTLTHADGDQHLATITLHLSPGLLGMLSSVTPCAEPQGAQGTCGPDSLIGHTLTSVGLGPDPYPVSGTVYITRAYKGAPYGLSIVTRAIAGPYDLGTVVVRAKIEVDPHTSALTVTSDTLPTILQGIPLQIKRVNVTIDRPGFTFNPTNCSQQPINATVTGDQGAVAPLWVPFAVANCAILPFTPKFLALTHAYASKANGVYLHVKVTSGPGQANIAKVRVLLPKELPSRLTTLQKACPDATFNANPALCRAESILGTAYAVTPVLRSALTGPAYLVSHAGAAFPDLVIVLQGEGIAVQLVGNTDIKRGVTSSTFNAVPDAPISTFDLVLPQGPHSALGAYLPASANGRLCHQPLAAPTTITAQNGAVLQQTTRIAVMGCAAHKPKKAKKDKITTPSTKASPHEYR